MEIANTGLAGIERTLGELDALMDDLGFVRWAWDYDKAYYDFKLVDKDTGATYYLRVPADAVKGRLENPMAVLKLKEPVIAKHLFPHGLDYDAPVPVSVEQAAKRALDELKAALEKEESR
ncbi:MAG: YugN-like family protein [Calditerricola sp.]|nr:YugN-like family protein [Calditerricola sp.]